MTEPATAEPPARRPQLRLVDGPRDDIEVVVPDEPPHLPPRAAWTLLTILRRAHLNTTTR
jgi:hypothetical protein